MDFYVNVFPERHGEKVAMQMQEVEELFETFHTISGMQIILYDRYFHYIMGNKLIDTAYCNYIHKFKNCFHTCLQSDKDAFRIVDQTKKPYRYTCPFGLFEAIVPILEGDQVEAYLFIGPALETGPGNENVPVKAARHKIGDQTDGDTLPELVHQLAHYSSKELDAYCHLLEVFSQYLKDLHALPLHRQSIGQLTKHYIQENFNKKISLAELSMNLHCSTVTLTESFRKEWGCTVMQYVTKKRMQLAESLLMETHTSIAEIAEACGFSDVAYFSKCFKNTHGVSPSEWRKQ